MAGIFEHGGQFVDGSGGPNDFVFVSCISHDVERAADIVQVPAQQTSGS